MSGKSKTLAPCQYLLIKLQSIQFRSAETIKDYEFVYFSFAVGERMHFSSCIDSKQPTLSDDIVVAVESQELPDFVSLHRWENHMIMFSHEIDISELKTRTTTKKKHETKAGEILSFMILLLSEEELKFGDKYVQSISQHYFIIEQMYLKEGKTQTRVDPGPSYYLIRASGCDFVMPVLDGQICIKLPETLEFEHIRNGKSAGKSRQYSSDELRDNNIEIELKSESGNTSWLNLKVKWGINFFETRTENSLLLEAHELVIYDIEVKFDSYNEYSNSRVKFVYGNKGFEVGNEFNTAKPAKIKKIVYFIIKSEDEEVSIVVERNLKIVAQSKFYTDQITSYMVHSPKRKFIDENGKVVGMIKFKCEKAKNLSTPNNNNFWKESSKKKLLNTVLLSVEQISVAYEKDDPVCVTIKTENEERTVNNVPNFLYFDKNTEVSYAPIVITAKPDESVYLMVKNQVDEKSVSQRETQPQNDFIGIAILNFAEMRLGTNSTEIPFFKNQGRTATCHCLINKVTSYPFVKSSFQPEILQSGAHKTMSLSIFMKRVIFTPYFYTYRYDNKNEVYCIVEVNRLKKVLIMEGTLHDELTFMPSASSDSLSFYVEDAEYIKVKVTFLVSDVGHEEEIYGSALVKMKIGQLNAAPEGLKFNKVELKNQFGNDVGLISLEVHQGALNGSRAKEKQPQPQESVAGPFKSEIKRVQKDLNKINQNMEMMELSLKKNKGKSPPLGRSEELSSKNLKKPSARYDNSVDYVNKRKERNHSVAGTNNESIKLPQIKGGGKGKNNLKELVNMMKIRKRDPRGYYEENSNIQQYQPKYPASEREYVPKGHLYDPPFHTEKGSRENPGGMEVMFPGKQKKDNIQSQINEYEEKLRRLKQQLQTGQDNELVLIDNRTRENFRSNKKQQLAEQDLEFEDNEFIRHN